MTTEAAAECTAPWHRTTRLSETTPFARAQREGHRPAYRVTDINDVVTRRRGPLRELTQDRESEPPAPERPRNEP